MYAACSGAEHASPSEQDHAPPKASLTTELTLQLLRSACTLTHEMHMAVPAVDHLRPLNALRL